jgi:hypothetical protein
MADSQLDAVLTSRYGKWQKPPLNPNKFVSSLPFVNSSDRSGKEFRFPIQVAFSQGATVDKTGGIVDLNGARSGKNKEAILDGINIYIQEQISYSDIMKMSNGSSSNGDAPSYDDPLHWTYYNMILGLEHHSEMMALYGAGTGAAIGADIGVFHSTALASGSAANISLDNCVAVISTASWARLLWLNSTSGGDADKGMLVDIYQSNGSTLVANNVRVVGVANPRKCQVSFKATAATSTGASYVPTAGHRIVPAGWLGKSALGVSGIAQTNGTFANIDNTLEARWKMENMDLGGSYAVDFDMFANWAAGIQSNGFDSTVFEVWSSTGVQASLTNKLSPLQRWNGGEGQDEKIVGANSVGVVHAGMRFSMRPYGYVKQSELLVLARGEWNRIGAEEERTDGLSGQGIALELQGKSGTEMRAMCQFAPLPMQPSHSGRLSGFTAAGNDQASAT